MQRRRAVRKPRPWLAPVMRTILGWDIVGFGGDGFSVGWCMENVMFYPSFTNGQSELSYSENRRRLLVSCYVATTEAVLYTSPPSRTITMIIVRNGRVGELTCLPPLLGRETRLGEYRILLYGLACLGALLLLPVLDSLPSSSVGKTFCKVKRGCHGDSGPFALSRLLILLLG